NDNGLPLIVAGHDKAVACRHDRIGIPQPACEFDHPPDSHRDGQLLELLLQRALTDDDQLRTGNTRSNMSECSYQSSMVLLRRKPANGHECCSGASLDEARQTSLTSRFGDHLIIRIVATEGLDHIAQIVQRVDARVRVLRQGPPASGLDAFDVDGVASTDEFLCRSVICEVLSIDLIEPRRDGDESIKITIELEYPSQVLEMRANPIDLALSIRNKIIVEPDDLSGCTCVSNYPSPVRRISAEVHGRIEPCMAEYPTPFPIPDCRAAVTFGQFLDRRPIQLMHAAE